MPIIVFLMGVLNSNVTSKNERVEYKLFASIETCPYWCTSDRVWNLVKQWAGIWVSCARNVTKRKHSCSST